MSTPNTKSLFHYTRRKKDFIGILKNGFSYTYCLEEWGNYKKAIPMICFCDIPLSRVNLHKRVYGSFAIALTKKSLCDNPEFQNILHPVWYIRTDSLTQFANFIASLPDERQKMHNIQLQNDILEGRAKALPAIGNDFELSKFIGSSPLQAFGYEKPNVAKMFEDMTKDAATKGYSDYLLAFSKRFKGDNKRGKEVDFYDEKEWRAVLPNKPPYQWIGVDEYYSKKAVGRNQTMTRNGILFDVKDVSHIIVNKENQVEWLIREIQRMKIFGGKELADNDKILLLTKITSFESIENDF